MAKSAGARIWKGGSTVRWLGRVLLVLAALAAIAGVGFLLRPVSYFDGLMYLQERFAGVESKSVKIAGHRMHYLAQGPANGPVVVLVHGLGGSAEDWRELAPYLARAGFRVYMPDLLGYGRSDRPQDFSYSVRDESGVVLGFMDVLRLKQVNLGGWSMGGWIVELVAAEHPERVKKLMVFDSAGLDVRPAWDTNLFTPRTKEELDELDALLMPQPPQVPGYVAKDILRVSRERAWVVQRALATMMTAQDVTDKLLPQLPMPVLIEWGGLDKITPVDQAKTIHRLVPQSELDVFGDCGHLAALQCAAQMGPKVVSFVEQ